MSVFDILEGAKFAEDDVDICLRSDLNYKMEQLQKEIQQTLREDEQDQRLGARSKGSDRIQELENEIQAMEAQMSASVLTFHMRGVSETEYDKMQMTAGRPRKEMKVDQQVGYNMSEFCRKAIKRCTFKVVAPDGDEQKFKDEQWEMVWASITDAQMDDLVACMQKVNRRTVRVPTQARTFGTVNGSEQKQLQPTDSASATSDSADGSPES